MTTIHPTDLGLDPDRLRRLTAAIDDDVTAERYDGAVVLVARGGQVALHEAIGWADRAAGRRAPSTTCSRSSPSPRRSRRRHC
jgi:hypothetical protein